MLRMSLKLAAVGSAAALLTGDATAFFPPLPVARDPQVTVVPPAPSPIIAEPPAVVVVPPRVPSPIIPAAPIIPPVPEPPFVPPVVVVVTPPPPSPIVRPPHDCPPAPTGVPEPATLLSAAIGAVTIGVWRRRAVRVQAS